MNQEKGMRENISYFVLSVIMVDKEGLNIRSLIVSIKVEGAVSTKVTSVWSVHEKIGRQEQSI